MKPHHILILSGLLFCLAGCMEQKTMPTATPQPLKPTETLPPSPTPQPKAGDTRTDPKGIEQVWVPAGSFQMGTSEKQAQDLIALNPPGWIVKELNSEQPQHEVRLTQGYWIDKYEVTNAAFQAFAADGGYQKKEFWSEEGWKWLQGRKANPACSTQGAKDKPNHPCVNVRWYEAEAYAAWRSGRLPSEAEWEYAARGPQSLVYPWGNEFDEKKANVLETLGVKPVGSYPDGASWVGAMDMAGNAMEWVNDWLDPTYYQQKVSENPPGPKSGTIKIEKGGWWGSNPYVARCSYRHFEDPPEYCDSHIGFRIVTDQK
jgi:formylglycine-generating enzyme required for sulfatase activity